VAIQNGNPKMKTPVVEENHFLEQSPTFIA
jgi:hypothetical protein